MTTVTSNSFTVPAALSGVIATRAASMASNTWEQVTGTTGLATICSNYLAGTYGNNNGNRGFFEFATSGHWVAAHGELLFRGGGHLSTRLNVRYVDSTGVWSVISADDNSASTVHQYDHTTYDSTNDIFYSRRVGSKTIDKWAYSSGAGTWTTAASLTQGWVLIASALEWFPDANSGAGGLIYYDAYDATGTKNGGIWLSNAGVSSWSYVGSVFSGGAEDYHTTATYLPAQGVVMVGGGNGSNQTAVVNAAGTITTKANAPAHLGPADNNGGGTILADSVTGRIIFLSQALNGLYEYDYSGNAWNLLKATLPSSGGRFFASMIPEHGVILFVNGDSTGTPSEWLYKL